jgi:hypothetical protein
MKRSHDPRVDQSAADHDMIVASVSLALSENQEIFMNEAAPRELERVRNRHGRAALDEWQRIFIQRDWDKLPDLLADEVTYHGFVARSVPGIQIGSPAAQQGGMSKPAPARYRNLNWSSYNAALRKRGSLTVWFNPSTPWRAAPSCKRGAQPVYSGDPGVPDGSGALRTAASPDDGLRGEPAEARRAGLAGPGLLDALPTPEDAGRATALPRQRRAGLLPVSWTARASRSEAKENGTPASMAEPSAASGARSTSPSTRQPWKSGLKKLPN